MHVDDKVMMLCATVTEQLPLSYFHKQKLFCLDGT